jgi:hypothetical protein
MTRQAFITLLSLIGALGDGISSVSCLLVYTRKLYHQLLVVMRYVRRVESSGALSKAELGVEQRSRSLSASSL